MEIKQTEKLLKNRNYILLFLGGLVSRTGNNIHYIAITWFVLELTGSGTATGTLLLLASLPWVLMGPISGIVVDRVNRKAIIVSMDILRGLIVLWLGWTVYSGIAGFTHLAIATILTSSCGAFFDPAVTATIPNIVSDKNLQQANSYEQLSYQLTTIIGAALGGVLLAAVGVAGAMFLNGVSFLLSAFSELFIDIPPLKNSSRTGTGYLEDLKAGGSFIYGSKPLFSLFGISVLMNFLCSGVISVGLPYLFKEVLQVSSRLYGFAQSPIAIGAMLGAILLSFLPEVKNYYRTLGITITMQTLALLSLSIPILPAVISRYQSNYIYISLLILLFILGVFNALGNIPIMVLLQRMIPDDIRGRVFALLTAFNTGLVPVSMLLSGWLLDTIPAYSLFMGAGLIMGLVLLFAFRIKAIKD